MSTNTALSEELLSTPGIPSLDLELTAEDLTGFEQKSSAPTLSYCFSDIAVQNTLKRLEEGMHNDLTLLEDIQQRVAKLQNEFKFLETDEIRERAEFDLTLEDVLEAQSGKMDAAYGRLAPEPIPAAITPEPTSTYIPPAPLPFRPQANRPGHIYRWMKRGASAAAALTGVAFLTGALLSPRLPPPVQAYSSPPTSAQTLFTNTRNECSAKDPLGLEEIALREIAHPISDLADLARLSYIPDIDPANFIYDEPSPTTPPQPKPAEKYQKHQTTLAKGTSKPKPTLPFYITEDDGTHAKLRQTGRYGNRINPITKKPQWHPAYDHSVPLDRTLYWQTPNPALEGAFTVSQVSNDSMNGHYVRATYGPFTLTLCHLGKVLVKEGDTLTTGKEIAESGKSGRTWVKYIGNGTVHSEAKMTDPNGRTRPVPYPTFLDGLAHYHPSSATQQASLITGTR
ncbi:MAG: M23 family metallopeptidase [Nanoarchaeota archaeon]